VSAAERANPANHYREFTDNEALRNFRFYAELHTRLFPYIYTFAQESSKSGLPILRPLLLLHQDDRKTFDIKHVYYFGSELVVAPVVDRNVTARGVYLPKGRWIDFWTNERIDHSAGGGNHAWSNGYRTKLPVFAREGAILPMLADLPQTLCDANCVNNDQIRTPTDGLQVRVYPALRLSSSFTTARTSHAGPSRVWSKSRSVPRNRAPCGSQFSPRSRSRVCARTGRY
jgi:alpha-glucosidase (family GH31 glycosyl hydrolase)